MRVANSYVNYNYDETEAYDNNGKLYVHATCTCDRCGGTGIYASRVENGQIVPHPAYNGVCLQCDGSGIVSKEIRLYTDKEFESMEKATAKANEKKKAELENKMKSEFAQKRAKWLSDNGFNQDGETYIYFPEDSYEVKETLKSAGFRFSKPLLWHIGAPAEEYMDSVVKLTIDECVEFAAWGDGYFKKETAEIVENLLLNARPEKEFTSEWIGEVKDKIEVTATLVFKRTMETRFGYTTLFKFSTEEGNILQWWTSTFQDFEVGDFVKVKATVKAHDEYKGEKITSITRAKLLEV